jgi:beta-lactam-binding protein with PASTA domain
MVTGKAPFAGDNPVTIAYKHVREDAVRPTEVNRAVPAALEAIILQAMAKDPADRYQSAEDLRLDLLRYVQGVAVTAEPPPPTTVMAATGPRTSATRVQQAVVEDLEEDPHHTGAWVAALVVMLAVLAVLLFFLGKQLGVFGKSGSSSVQIPPDIVGKPVADATTELKALGLNVQASAPQGNVVSSAPSVGTTVKKGTTVHLTVNTPPPIVSVTSVVGDTQAAATTALQQQGFTVAAQQQNSDTVAQGTVISQSPLAGSPLAKGQAVTIVVSLGKAQVVIPDESTKDPATAGNDLGNDGLKTREAFEPSTLIAAGLVTRTDPPAGTQVPKGSTVVIYVSTGAPQVPVPDTIGKTQAVAQSELTAAGFNVNVTTVPTSDPAQVGVVVAQSPSGGKAPKGSTVAITVGVGSTTTTGATTTTT